MGLKIPFNIGFDENTQLKTKEIHLSFSAEFQAMDQAERVKVYQNYIEHLIAQAQLTEDELSQKGVITILEITEQLFPHIQSGQMPLQETIIVEIGDKAEGCSLDELLSPH